MTTTEKKAALRNLLSDLSIMTALGVVLALIGPFATFALPFAWRLVYWVALCWGGYACYRPIAGFLVRLGRELELPELAAWIAACLIATIPMAVLVWLLGQIPGPITLPPLEQALAHYGNVLVIGGTLTSVFYFIDRSKNSAVQQTEPARPLPGEPGLPDLQARFLERIPARLGPDLLALEMEDHYLRIHTSLGSDLILMRMRDAVAELDGIEGAQVHRSWWVARAAVRGVARDGRNMRLQLTGDLSAPVARDQTSALKAAGWF